MASMSTAICAKILERLKAFALLEIFEMLRMFKLLSGQQVKVPST